MAYEILSIPQVPAFAYDTLQNDLHIGFGKDIRDRIDKARWKDETKAEKVLPEKLDDQITPFLMAYSAEDDAYVIQQGSDLTKQRDQKDQERDQLYKEIKRTVDTFATLTIFPEKQAKALVMQPLMQKYKIDPDGGVEAQTVATDQWLQEQLRNYQMELAAKELGIYESINRLKTLNDEVRRLTSLRNDERSQQTTAALKTARAETERAYRAMILALNAVTIVTDDNYALTELVKSIAETIKYYRQISEQRKRANAALLAKQKAANEAKRAEKEQGKQDDAAPADADVQPEGEGQTDGGEQVNPDEGE